jgi:putative restriction endonuclease
MWLEMSRDKEHGGPGWDFAERVWSPTQKKKGPGTWPYWQAILKIKDGDIVFHLRGKTGEAAFVGYSIAAADGHRTSERPSILGKQWAHATEFFRAPLKEFVPFEKPIQLPNVFQEHQEALKIYFLANKTLPPMRREHLFYVVQRKKLQCFNGAYLSDMSERLAEIIFGPDFSGTDTPRPPSISVQTGQQLSTLKVRIGQRDFSMNVRDNYGGSCCFPNCHVKEPEFLVGAHIARWADAPHLRGLTSNGLCLCLFHDRAFELGYFTLSRESEILVQAEKIKESAWAKANLAPFQGKAVKAGKVMPLEEAIEIHWERIGYKE